MPYHSISFIIILLISSLGFTANPKDLYNEQALFSPLDQDGNGIFEQLQVELTVDFPASGYYFIHAHLSKAGQLVANQSYYDTSIPVRLMFDAPGAGKHKVLLRFSGEQILRSGLDGPYDLRLSAIGQHHAHTNVTAVSPPLDHTTFGERPVTVLGGADSTVDLNSDGVFDLLRINVDLRVFSAGDYQIKATLLGRGDSIRNLRVPVTLAPGNQSLILDFPGVAIYRAQMDGPYEIVVNVTQHDITVASFVLNSQTYQYLQFNAPPELVAPCQPNQTNKE